MIHVCFTPAKGRLSALKPSFQRPGTPSDFAPNDPPSRTGLHTCSYKDDIRHLVSADPRHRRTVEAAGAGSTGRGTTGARVRSWRGPPEGHASTTTAKDTCRPPAPVITGTTPRPNAATVAVPNPVDPPRAVTRPSSGGWVLGCGSPWVDAHFLVSEGGLERRSFGCQAVPLRPNPCRSEPVFSRASCQPVSLRTPVCHHVW